MTTPRRKSPTCTSQVLAALAGADDFMSAPMLRKATGLSVTQVSASCIMLRAYRAVDCIVDPHGVAWWYATPETDTRTRHLEERTPESKPRRPRRSKTTIQSLK